MPDTLGVLVGLADCVSDRDWDCVDVAVRDIVWLRVPLWLRLWVTDGVPVGVPVRVWLPLQDCDRVPLRLGLCV